jgi:hypothetical protein
MANKNPNKVGTVRKGKFGPYVKFEDNVELHVDGRKVDLGKHNVLNLRDPVKFIDYLEEKGIITPEEAEKRHSQMEKMDWLRYEIILPKETK